MTSGSVVLNFPGIHPCKTFSNLEDSMKAFFLFTLFIVSQSVFAQKDGFEAIKIGKNFYDKSITDDYDVDFRSTDSLIFRLQGKLPKFLCEEAVDYLDVEIGTDSIIKRVNLYTVGKTYPDKNTFINNYQKISECVVHLLGKPHYLDNGRNNRDKMKTAGWKFPELQTVFVIYTYDVPMQINNVRKLFKMVWRVYDPKESKTSW